MRCNQSSDKTQFDPPEWNPIGYVAACLIVTVHCGGHCRRSGAAGSVEAGIEAIRKILARSVFLAQGLRLITAWIASVVVPGRLGNWKM